MTHSVLNTKGEEISHLITPIYNKLEEIFKHDQQFQLVMLVRTGSRAYGTATPQSDVDLVAVVIPPINYLVGTKKWDSLRFTVDDKDIRIYSFSKFVSLLANNNPNVLELLWLPSDCYLQLHSTGSRLLDNRGLFLSQKVLHSFGGCANQLKKESGLGAKGKEEAETLGYNPKAVMHNVRLLFMLNELLETGKFTVRRPEADFLLDIRSGTYSKEYLEALSEDLVTQAETLFASTKLPENPDFQAIDRFLTEEHVRFIDYARNHFAIDLVANYYKAVAV